MVKTKYVLFPHLRSCAIFLDVAVTDFYYRKMCSVPNLHFRNVPKKNIDSRKINIPFTNVFSENSCIGRRCT